MVKLVQIAKDAEKAKARREEYINILIGKYKYLMNIKRDAAQK
jgi:hypothetical protein